jgi:hypothetical protein
MFAATHLHPSTVAKKNLFLFSALRGRQRQLRHVSRRNGLRSEYGVGSIIPAVFIPSLFVFMHGDRGFVGRLDRILPPVPHRVCDMFLCVDPDMRGSRLLDGPNEGKEEEDEEEEEDIRLFLTFMFEPPTAYV